MCIFIRFPGTEKTFAEIQLELNEAAAQLNEAAGEVVTASQGPPTGLANASEKYGDAFCDFMDSGMTVAGMTRVSLTSRCTYVRGTVKTTNFCQITI